MANIVIDIASEFTGAKAFKQAETSTQKLTNGVKKLAGALGVAYGTTAILAYSKRAVKAAAADEKAQKQLALALNNVGLGRDAASSEAYIQRLQREFGIVDDLLRPAYQTLAIATQDTLQSQRLLNLALDISAATGKDLGSVTAALSKAYLGNNTSLTRLGVGISKADLKTKSFLEVTDQLAKTFKGAATESANSLSGSMAKLEVATANVSEILGKGIIDSLMVLGNDTSVGELATDMETAATNAAKLLVTISKVIKAINTPLEIVSGSLAAFVEKTSPLVNLIVEGDPSGFMKSKPKPFSTGMSVSGQSQSKAVSSSQTKVQKETLKINKESLKLAKARATFDLQKIQIEAALKGKISAEDAIRLKLMKAIEEENLGNIEKYQKALTAAQEKTKELATALAAIKSTDTGDPFSKWPDYVKTAIELTNTVAQASLQAGLNAGVKLSEALSGARYAAQAAAAADAASSAAAITGAYGAASAAAAKAAADAATANAAAIAGSNKTAADAITSQLKAQQDAFAEQSKAQQEALTAQSAAQLAALKARLADEAAAYAELAAATQAAAEAAFILGTNDSATRNAAILATQAAAQAAAAQAALAAAESASASAGGTTTGGSVTNITVNGALDANAVADQINEILTNSANDRGNYTGVGSGFKDVQYIV
jgi:hypothetical protein